MEKISLFNYEAFYLDYLEGNLSVEDTALLLTFLEQHPELKLDDEHLPLLDDNVHRLDTQFKSDLKQIMFNETAITSENVDQFMIAQTEKLLDQKKLNELDAFIGNNSSLRRTSALYAATRIKPDYSIVFTDKENLKRSKRMVLWPYISFAAAAAVIAFIVVFMQNDNRSLNSLEGPGLAVSDSLNKIEQKKSDEKQIKALDEHQLPVDDVFVPGKTFATIEKEKEPKVIPFNENQNDLRKDIDPIKLRSPKAFDIAHKYQDIIETKRINPSEGSTVTRTSDYAQLGFQEMNNPIKPLTNRLGNLVNQEVDFRTSKATRKNSGGFYLKIGKFELSHKKH
jgi:hypothetical protein